MVTNSYYIQKGSSPDFRTANESKFYLIRETFENGRSLNISIVGTYNTRPEAYRARINAEKQVTQ